MKNLNILKTYWIRKSEHDQQHWQKIKDHWKNENTFDTYYYLLLFDFFGDGINLVSNSGYSSDVIEKFTFELRKGRPIDFQYCSLWSWKSFHDATVRKSWRYERFPPGSADTRELFCRKNNIWFWCFMWNSCSTEEVIFLQTFPCP